MSLPNVEWRYVGTRSVTNVTIDTVMDNIYTLAIATEYIDGTARIQGSGSAGSWSRYQTGGGVTESIYVTPPSGSQKIIIAGSSTTPSPSPTMASPDTYTTNVLMVNVIKDPGNFSSWNAANPFTSGTSFGYYKFLGARGNGLIGITSFTGNVYLYESKESIAVFLIAATAGSSSTSYSNGFLAGALFDAESDNSTDVESDGRLYGIISSGHTATGGVGWSVSTSNVWGIDQFNAPVSSSSMNVGFLGITINTNSSPHIGVFSPGTSTIKQIDIMMYPVLASNSSSSLVTPSGKFARIPLLYRYKNTSQIVGRLREISLCQRGLIGQRHMNGSNTIGYVVSCSDYAPTPADAILLEH
jgi:hypothetical protein